MAFYLTDPQFIVVKSHKPRGERGSRQQLSHEWTLCMAHTYPYNHPPSLMNLPIHNAHTPGFTHMYYSWPHKQVNIKSTVQQPITYQKYLFQWLTFSLKGYQFLPVTMHLMSTCYITRRFNSEIFALEALRPQHEKFATITLFAFSSKENLGNRKYKPTVYQWGNEGV